MNLQHIEKQEFFKICKQFIVGGSVDDPSVTFLKNCNNKFVTPCPVFVKIQNCALNLIGYRLNLGHAQSTANYISEKTDDPSVNVETLILHNNDCCDRGFAAILEAMIKQR